MNQDKVTIVAACAVDHEIYYMSCRLNNFLVGEPYSRLFFYQEKTKEKFFYHDQPKWKVVSTCFKPATLVEERAVCALSEEGEIEILKRSETTVERISEAGLRDERGIGYVTRIRVIADELYVCGDQNQVYRRTNGKWAHIDSGILFDRKPDFSTSVIENRKSLIAAVSEESCLFDIAGNSPDDIYAVGTNGCILHYNGKTWRRLKKITASDLYEIHLDKNNELLIVGSKGTIISGNKNLGFQVDSRKSVKSDFISVTKHNEDILIGASDGIYVKNKQGITRLPLGISDVSHIESLGNIVWAASSRKILKYESGQWRIIKHIDNLK